METDAKVQDHRTFLRSLSQLKKDPKYDDDTWFWYRNHGKDFEAMRLVSGKLQSFKIFERRNQNFEKYLTPWEREWSTLMLNRFRLTGEIYTGGLNNFTPIVDGYEALIGHYGKVPGGSTNLIVPFGAVQMAPKVGVYMYKDRSGASYRVENLRGMLRDGVRVFVHHWDSKPPAGWVHIDVLTTEHQLQVRTGPDGELLSYEARSTGFLESPTIEPDDILGVGKLLVDLGAKVGTKVVKALASKATANREARALLNGPTAKLAKESEEALARKLAKGEASMIFKGLKLGRGYHPDMGIWEKHYLAMVDAAKEANVIAIFRANKPASIDLIKKGAHGKPMWAKFQTNKETGVLTARNFGETYAVNMNGHFVVAAEDLANGLSRARKVTMVGGKPVTEFVQLKKPYWDLKEGQVIAKDGHPVVGDYDLLGVAPIKSPGRAIGPVPDDIAYGDWSGPDVKRYLDAVNKKSRLDEPRVLHGAQDMYGGNPKYMGLTDDTAYAVFPDGRTYIMRGRKAQEEFYAAMGRQAKSPGAPIGRPGWHLEGDRVVR